MEIGDTGIAGENVYVESFDVDLTPDQLFTMFIDVVLAIGGKIQAMIMNTATRTATVIVDILRIFMVKNLYMMYVFCKNNQNFRIWFMKRDFYRLQLF